MRGEEGEGEEKRGVKEKLRRLELPQLAKSYVTFGRRLVILHLALRRSAQGCSDVCECACAASSRHSPEGVSSCACGVCSPRPE